jgi:Protein of unknown function (DUF2442)
MASIAQVIEVQPLGSHRLHLRFDDGAEGDLDMSEETWDGVFAPLADPDFFDKVSVDEELGTIVWPNGADIAPDSLHACVTGQLSKLPS